MSGSCAQKAVGAKLRTLVFLQDATGPELIRTVPVASAAMRASMAAKCLIYEPDQATVDAQRHAT